MAEVLTVFFSSVAGISILTPAHLLWINMVTDSVPALALGMEKAEGDLMRRKPRDSSEGLFSSGAGIVMALQGIYISAVVVFSFFLGQYMELGHMGLFKSADGMSMAFITMNFVEIFHALCMRSRHGSIFKMKTVNKWLAGAMALSFILTVCIMYIPFLASAFGITAINLGEFAAAFGLALSVIPVIEIMKAVMRRKYPEY